MVRNFKVLCSLALLLSALPLIASEDPIEARQELMEGARDGVKAIGAMLKRETPFDSDEAMNGLQAMQKAANEAGELFPEGSETGHDTEAKSTVWTDREGFDQELADFAVNVEAAIAANPQNLDTLNTVMKPIFKNCKSCHEGYRVEKD